MDIRPTTEADLPAIRAIINREILEGDAHFATEPWTLEEVVQSWRLGHERHPWYSAINDEGATVGFAKSGPWSPRAAYAWTAEVSIYVHPDSQRQGLGKALYTALFDHLVRMGYRRIIGGIALPNPASVRLHESMGMARVALYPQIGYKNGRWIDVGYWMTRIDGDAPPAPLDESR